MGNAGETMLAKRKRFGISRFVVPHKSFEWYMRAIGLTALATGLFLGVTSWVYQQQLFAAMGMSQLAEQSHLLDQYIRLSLISTIIVAVTSALYITLMGGFLLHRISGPIYRIKQHMSNVIAGGPVEEIRLRKTDQLGDVCDTYNQLLHSLDLIEPKPLEGTNAEQG